MGKTRPRKDEHTGAEDVLSEEVGRKLVASIVDDKHTRLKILLRGHSKKAVATYREKDTTLSLLQFACIVGNVQAAEVLLGLGADKNIEWEYSSRPGGFHQSDVKWLPVNAQMRIATQSENIWDTKPPMCIQPMSNARLSILHLAALANKPQMVCFLVKNKHLPVDIRAGGTGLTPLMAVATKRCSWLDGIDRTDHHSCGHPRDLDHQPPADAEDTCASLLPMFQLLLDLDADYKAVDACGCDWLAAAAAAGDHGLWDALMTAERMAAIRMDTVHANRVLHRAAQYSCAAHGGRPGFFTDALQCLQQIFKDQGASEEELVRQLSEPVADLVPDGAGGWKVQPSHVLLAAMTGSRGAQVVMDLLGLGVPLDCLRINGEDLPIGLDYFSPVGNVLVAVRHLVQRGEPLVPQRRLLMALFINSCLHPYPKDGPVEGASKEFGELVKLMVQNGLDFREERLCMCFLEGQEVASAPFTAAIMVGCTPAVSALLSVLCSLGEYGFVNCQDPDGRLPLVLAAGTGNVATCAMLIAAGAHVMCFDGNGGCPLQQLAHPDARSLEPVARLLVAHLKQTFEERPAEVLEYLHKPRPGGLTLVQMAAFAQADFLVELLAQIPMQLNLTHTAATPLRIVCERPGAGQEKEGTICVLVSRSDPATVEALTERDSKHGLTVLGQAVAWGQGATIGILAGACRREGLELAPLLERHMERSRFHMPLFTAITHKYPTAIAMLLDCGLQLTPEISSEYLLLTPEARLPGGQLSGREFVREPRPGETESLSLLMCAASVGDALAVKLLLEAGVDARDEPFPDNRWYKNALTAAIDFPDLAGFPGGDSPPDGATSSMGQSQLDCVYELLQAHGCQAAMTQRQLYKVVDTLYQFSDNEGGMDAFRFLSRKLAQCRRCQLVGCWRKCAGCRSVFYCGVDCQAADWTLHREHCSSERYRTQFPPRLRPPKQDIKGAVAV